MKQNNAWAILALIPFIFSGCDLNSTSSTTEPSAPQSLAARTVVANQPFGTKFIWTHDQKYGATDLQFQSADLIYQQQRENIANAAKWDMMITKLIRNLDTEAYKNKYPGLHLYGIPDVLPEFRDCNVAGSGEDKCSANAAKRLFERKAQVLEHYKVWAQLVQKNLDARKVSKMPVVWLLEGDVMQYADYGETQNDPNTFNYYTLGTFLNEIRGVINQYCPNSIVGYTASAWFQTKYLASFIQGVKSGNGKYGKSFEFVWVNSGLNKSNLDNNGNADVTYKDYRTLYANTGLPMLLEGVPTTTTTASNIADRISEGVVSAQIPSNPAGFSSIILAGKSLPIAAAPKTLSPEMTVALPTRIPSTNSVLLNIKAFDFSHQYGTAAIKKLTLLINGKAYQTITNNDPANLRRSDFSFTIFNPWILGTKKTAILTVIAEGANSKTVTKSVTLTAANQIPYNISRVKSQWGYIELSVAPSMLSKPAGAVMEYKIYAGDVLYKTYATSNFWYTNVQISTTDIAELKSKNTPITIQLNYKDAILAASTDRKNGWELLQKRVPLYL